MNKIKFLVAAFTFVFAMINTNAATAQEMGSKKMDKMSAHTDVTVIELAQVDGAFTTEGLSLKPGKYQFKVTNTEVDHEVGFVIQKAADKDGDVMKTAVENSFSTSMIAKGKTVPTGIVELTVGEYVYSCPMNPTPKYKLTVK